jgi:putative glutamine amidotransferase
MNARPHIAIPEPTSFDQAYNQRGWPQYARAIELAGGVPVPVPLTESQATVAKIVSGCSGILLPGSGADVDPQKYGQERHAETAAPDPVREAVEELLLQDAFNLHKPILGICYGLQSLNVWRNGALEQHIPGTGVDHAPGRDVLTAHPLQVVRPSHLAEILRLGAQDAGPVVNSSHHQAVQLAGDGLAIVARSEPDGIIEAVEGISLEQFVLGVQWHPERTYYEHASSRLIFAAFVQAAASWKIRPVVESVVESVSETATR